MKIKEFLRDDLIFLEEAIASDEAAFQFMGDKAQALGLVKDSFGPSLVEREREFPTGILVNDTGIAISHTDPEHIEEEFIGLIRPSQPVSFKLIDDPEKDIPVKLIFVLGLKKAVNQLESLKEITKLIEDPASLEKLLNSQDIKSIL
ncbi:PTS sugar transporter subunit IIA [Ignavigranum ruoffiae]|uniref:PTS sugar transporter subunit IIA n=1 Tax=Ignavigranum ruoffiae TaxID=89093 RepID=UPI002353378E|nr:PTS sugar transporter subunit IIA [Ignavigranum ruoffiae]